MLKLPGHTRYAYSPLVERKDYSWPGGKRLAFYVARNIEHFATSARLVVSSLGPAAQDADR
jgi:allantoinase